MSQIGDKKPHGSIYYPQGVISLRVLFEDFSTQSVRLQNSYAWTVVAKNLKVNLNSYMEADTFSATIDYRNLPFDPRIIRSCGVSIYLENKKQIFDLNSGRGLDAITPSKDNIIFQGFADTDKMELSEDDRTITLEGRDFTALLIDREYLGDPIAPIDRVDVLLQALVNQLPQTKVDPTQPGSGLTVVPLGLNEEDIPRLSQLAPGKGPFDGQINPRSKRSYWDMIQQIVNNSGLIAYVSLDQLVLTKPRNLYDRKQSKVFVYGKNVKDLSFERKIGRQKGFNVRVVSINTEQKEVLEARIPEEATEEWSRDTGVIRQAVTMPVPKAPAVGNQEQGETFTKLPSFLTGPVAKPSGEPIVEEKKAEPAPYITFKIANIADKDHLVKIGEKIYEELGRQQIEGRLSTLEMKVYTEETRTTFDATKFRVGTPIEIRIDHGDLEGLNAVRRPAARNNDKDDPKSMAETRQRILSFLKRRGYGQTNAKIAEAMADALTQFDTPFFTKAVEFTLDHEQGFSMELEFINFIEISKHLVEGKL
jgi:hypothetical protein